MNTSRQKSTEQSSDLISSHYQYSSKLNNTIKNKNNILSKKPGSISEKNKTIKKEYLYDIIKTMDINLKMIFDVTKIINMPKSNKNLIIKRMQIIKKLFDEFQSIRKEMLNLKSKNLVNSQIYSEIKRRMVESDELYKEKIHDYESIINKKVFYLKKTHKKFNEIQLYIRRESQNYFGYRKLFGNFFIKPFIIENEINIRYRQKINEDIERKKNIINILNNEIKEIRDKKNLLTKNNLNKNNIIINNTSTIGDKKMEKKVSLNYKLNNFLLSREEEIKYYESLNLYFINKKLVYERSIIFSMSNFFKDNNMIKNEINIDTEFSQELSDDISFFKNTNKNETLELNTSNTIMEIFTNQSNI